MSQNQSNIDFNAIIKLQDEYKLHPAKFFKDALGVSDKSLWDVPRNILAAIAKYKRVAIKSGHGVGKSWSCGRLPLWWLSAYGPNAKVMTTAPTFPQVKSIIWDELKGAHKNAIRPIGGELHDVDLWMGEGWWAQGLSTDDQQRFQGFHSDNLLLIYDEAGGIRPEIWTGGLGIATSENSRVLVIGNPIEAQGNFFNCFKPDSGYHTITISCLDTPNYKLGKLRHEGKITEKEYRAGIIPGLSSYEWVEQCRKEWGEDSALWHSKVLGDFPVEASNTLIPLAWVEQCRKEVIDLKVMGILREQRYVGVDVARFGSCATVITVYDGFNMLYQKEYNKRSNTQVAGFIIDTLRDEGTLDAPIAIDDTGLGGGVYDILKEQGYNVVQVILRSKSDDENKFFDLRTEVFWDLRDKFQKKTISIKDPDDYPRKYDKLAMELTGLTYDMDRRGRIKVTPKERMIKEMVKRGGEGESPDHADSLSLAVYAAKSRQRGRSRVPSQQFHFSGKGGY